MSFAFYRLLVVGFGKAWRDHTERVHNGFCSLMNESTKNRALYQRPGLSFPAKILQIILLF
ncbi:MAG: hypothetical protein AMS27_07205 [Bacteroides sp. SM23_62_1]|nr:MAG: hypothetical protein AMS27_07205 [Bacteroides sp. SM23_62_1]